MEIIIFQIYIPSEFIFVPGGQTRSASLTFFLIFERTLQLESIRNRGLSGELTAKIIKQAAMLPNDRMRAICDQGSYF